MKERNGSYGSTPKQNKRHEGSCRCHLSSKMKQKNVTDRMGVVYAKTKQVDDKGRK